jgi:uncharacterized membrane protein YgdD (TMEM256/DUF423 family)
VKPWELVLLLGAAAAAVWIVRRIRTGRAALAVLAVAVACVLAAVIAASIPLLVLGVVLFVASLALSYVSARRTRA